MFFFFYGYAHNLGRVQLWTITLLQPANNRHRSTFVVQWTSHVFFGKPLGIRTKHNTLLLLLLFYNTALQTSVMHTRCCSSTSKSTNTTIPVLYVSYSVDQIHRKVSLLPKHFVFHTFLYWKLLWRYKRQLVNYLQSM